MFVRQTGWVFAFIAVLASCVEPLGSRCGPGFPPCAAGQECVASICAVATDSGTSVDAGVTDAGTTADAGLDAGASSCACRPWDECVGSACTPRYGALVVQASSRSRVAVPVSATLVPVTGRTQNPPSELSLTASFLPGPGEPVRGALRHLGDGGYGGSIMTGDGGALAGLAALASGEWTVTVEWPDAGLRGTARSQIDLDPPGLEVSVPLAPMRLVVADRKSVV